MRVGILSDTHGLLPDVVLTALAGCDHLLHAGDVGDPAILDRLRQLAPVTAVRGNVDLAPPLAELPAVQRGEFGGLSFFLTHVRGDAERRFERERPLPALVVFGHSHRPELEWRGDTLWLNPGACGPRRFRLPATVARVTFRDGRMIPEILAIE